jgi:hypothetical protein
MMKVHGFDVPPAVEQACVERMLNGGPFTAASIVLVACASGVPNTPFRPVVYRFVDRLIQRERKAGKIRRYGMHWRAVA